MGEAHLRIFFIAILVGVIIAAVAGLPLLWDGSHYLLQLLNLQVPFLPKSRLINFPLQLLPLMASYFTQHIVPLRFIFSLCYTSVPFIALALSWWIVRKTKPTLMIWPALCIGFITIAGQMAFINEGNSVIQLFWPVFLAFLVPCSTSTFIVIGLIAALLAFSHPFGIVLIGFAALVAIYSALRTKRRVLWILASYFLLISLAGLVYSSVLDRSDAQLVSTAIIIEGFKTIGKLKAVGILCAYLVGGVVLLTSQLQQRLSFSFTAVLYFLLGLQIIGCGVFIVFASHPNLWYVNF